jgi:hypothetical protein
MAARATPAGGLGCVGSHKVGQVCHGWLDDGGAERRSLIDSGAPILEEGGLGPHRCSRRSRWCFGWRQLSAMWSLLGDS